MADIRTYNTNTGVLCQRSSFPSSSLQEDSSHGQVRIPASPPQVCSYRSDDAAAASSLLNRSQYFLGFGASILR